MAAAKSALYVNPVRRYEQHRVATALPRNQQPMQGSAEAKLEEKKKCETWEITRLHLILLQREKIVYMCMRVRMCV